MDLKETIKKSNGRFGKAGKKKRKIFGGLWWKTEKNSDKEKGTRK